MSTMQFRPKVLQPVHVPTPSPSSTNSSLSSSSNPLPPHEKGNTFFSPRPNDQYTPLEKIDATPGSSDSLSPFNYALQHQQQQQQLAAQQHFNPNQLQQPQYFSSPSNTFSSPSNAYSSPSNTFSSPSNSSSPPYNSHQQIHHTSLSRRPQHLDEHSHPFNPQQQQQQQHHPQQHFDQFNSHQGVMHHSHPQQSQQHLHHHSGESNLTQRTPTSYPSAHAHAHTDAFSLDSAHAGDDDENDHDHGWSKSSPTSSALGVLGFDSSMSAATFNLCNVILGSGIVSLPAAVEQAGVVAAFFILILQAIITRYSLGLLIQSGLKLKVFDYEELLRTAFGKGGWLVGLMSIFLLDFGVMLTFLIVVVDTFSPILAFYLGSEDSSVFMDRTFTLCFVSFLAILPLSLFRSLKSLAWVSMASVGAVIAIVLLVCWKLMFGDIPSSTVASSSSSSSGSLFTILGSNFLSAFGSMSFIYTCHDSSFAIFQSVRHPNLPKWKSIVSAAVGIALVPMLVLAYAGYFAFASSGLQSNVLNNFPRGDHLVNVARFALGASTVMTYPLNLFMCRHVIAKISGLHSSDRLTQQQHSVITLGLFLASLFIASSLRNLGVVQSLVGGIAGSMLAFILPAVAALKARQITEGRPFVHPDNGATLALLALGTVIMIASTFQTLFFD